ncbi:MAG: CpaF family protein [Actinobacteria bacterium]|nr:CpaF family protein [Actinomycetota bacterium]
MSDVLDVVLQRDELAALDVASRRLALRGVLRSHGAIDMLPSIVDHIDGFGPLGPLMRDASVTDVLVNGHREIWAERDGNLELTDTVYADADELANFIERMLGTVGRRADASHPIEDARLGDGSRMHVVMPPLSGAEPVISIRKFPRVPMTLGDLIAGGTATEEQAEMLRDLVRRRRSILVAGATGSGKTTLINALLDVIPRSERVITIEETPELRRHGGHHVSLVARSADAGGRGSVSLEELSRAALRMRPDRIVVGEVRGTEAAVAVDAMSTGHEGSLLTIHATGAAAALERLEDLARRPGVDAAGLSSRVRAAVQNVVFLRREGDVRRIVDIRPT